MKLTISKPSIKAWIQGLPDFFRKQLEGTSIAVLYADDLSKLKYDFDRLGADQLQKESKMPDLNCELISALLTLSLPTKAAELHDANPLSPSSTGSVSTEYLSPNEKCSRGRKRNADVFIDLTSSDDEEHQKDDDDTASESESDTESESESFKETVTPQLLSQLLIGTYFSQVSLDRDICRLYQIAVEATPNILHIASKLGECLGAKIDCSALGRVFIAIVLMSKDPDAADLVSPETEVFTRFWTERRVVVTCIMQGGKTRRAIIYRGLVHGWVHGKHVVVFTHNQRASCDQLRQAAADLNEDYRTLISNPLGLHRQQNEWCPTRDAILASELNKMEYWDKIASLGNTAHFNFRLFNKNNLLSLCKAFKYNLNLENDSLIIIDESHELERGHQSGQAAIRLLMRSNDYTLITATPMNHFVGNSLEKPPVLIPIYPRNGYYLYGHDIHNPTNDYADGYRKILVCKHAILDEKTEPDSLAVPFPFQHLVSLKNHKDKLIRSCVQQLNLMAQEQRSGLNVVVSEQHGSTGGGRGTYNRGLGILALHTAQNTQAHAAILSKDAKMPSIASISYFGKSSLPGVFASSRLFVNETLKKQIAAGDVDDLMKRVFTTLVADKSLKLIKPRDFQKLKTYLKRIQSDFRKIRARKNTEREMLTTTFGATKDDVVLKENDTVLHLGGIYSFSLHILLDLKCVLTLVQFWHESRPGETVFNYRKRPLKVFVMAKTLLKQSISVESYDRSLQATSLMFIPRGKIRVYTRIMQTLGRLDHGFNESNFYTSAFQEYATTVEERRPTCYLPKNIQNIVFSIPAANVDVANDFEGGLERLGLNADASRGDSVDNAKRIKEGSASYLVAGITAPFKTFLEYTQEKFVAKKTELLEPLFLRFVIQAPSAQSPRKKRFLLMLESSDGKLEYLSGLKLHDNFCSSGPSESERDAITNAVRSLHVGHQVNISKALEYTSNIQLDGQTIYLTAKDLLIDDFAISII